MKRRVKYVEFHDNLFLPGLGNLGKVFPSALRVFDIRMYYTDGSPVFEFVVNKRHLLVPVALAKGIEVEVPSDSKDNSE